MIVPSGRLLFVFALAGVLLAGLAPGSLTARIGLALFAAAAALDAARAGRTLAGLTAELPPIVRLTAERPGAIEVLLSRGRGTPGHLRMALPHAEEIGGSPEPLPVHFPAEVFRERVAWPCRPTRRGLHRVEEVCLEAPSPFGLWLARRCLPVAAELRVYPNLLRERRSLAAIFLRRTLPGVHAHRLMGKGREFDKLREYIPGDSSEDIHWKATAKRARPVTKIFQVERTQQIYVVLDSSRLSARLASRPGETAPGAAAPALDRSIEAALVLALAAERQGDVFGLVAFSDRIRRYLPARSGRAHFNACRDLLFSLEPEPVSPDFDELSTFLRLRLRRRALLFFLTDLEDPALAEAFVRNAPALARRHLVIVAMRRPPDAAPLFSGEAPADLDDVYRRLAGHFSWQGLRELEQVLRRGGIELALLDDERLAAEVVDRYLRVKQRQML
jgi:uncharacterized protein (DUF58 family)